MAQLQSKIENELLAATGLKLKKKEDRQDYLTRLMKTVSKLPDPTWESLSTEAQDWNNAAAEANTAGDELDDFPDHEEIEEPVDEEAIAKITAKPNGNGKAEQSKKEKPVVQHRKVSACHTIKKYVAKNPTISVADLTEKLKEDGFKVSDVTVATLRSDFRDSLRVLNELELGEFSL